MREVAATAAAGDPGVSSGQWLAWHCAQRPGLVAAVEAVIGDPYGTRAVACDWRDWSRGLQLLEFAARRGTVTFAGDDYRAASAVLESGRAASPGAMDGDAARRLARLVRVLGSYADDERDRRAGWGQRYASRPQTTAELKAAVVIGEGQVRPGGRLRAGIDGSRYALAWQARPGTGTRPVVVVANSAGGRELVPFKDEAAARGWLAGRLPGKNGPLAVAEAGPACRAEAEDALLAWLLRAQYDHQSWPLLRQVTWTTHLRAELAQVMIPQGEEAAATGHFAWRVRGQFAYALAVAPGWAVDGIGWPDGRRALRYVDRLAATMVTTAQARAISQALVRADTGAAMQAARARSVTAATPVTVAAATAARLAPGPRRLAATAQLPAAGHGGGRRAVQLPPSSQVRQAGREPRR